MKKKEKAMSKKEITVIMTVLKKGDNRSQDIFNNLCSNIDKIFDDKISEIHKKTETLKQEHESNGPLTKDQCEALSEKLKKRGRL